MSTTKAPFKGDGSWQFASTLSAENEKKRLATIFREFFPRRANETSPWGTPIPSLIADELLAESMWAAGEVYWHRCEITRDEMRAELSSTSIKLERCVQMLVGLIGGEAPHKERLINTLRGVSVTLKSLSNSSDRVLPLELAPRSCADQIESFINLLKSVRGSLNRQEAARSLAPVVLQMSRGVQKAIAEEKENASQRGSPSPLERQSWVAAELALRVARVLDRYRIPLGTGDKYEACSPAISLLAATGAAAGVGLSLRSWQPYLREAKNLL